MQIRIKKIILLSGLIFILLVSAAYSIKILGFEELRFDGALSINSTTLSIKTNNLVRMFVNTAGLVGINTSTPSDTLTVNGTMNIRPLGTSALFVQSDGNVGIGNTIPNNTLDVSGNANISGILHASGVNVSGTVEATTFIGDGSSLTGITTGTTGPWNASGTTLYLNDSRALVGIGTISPTAKLDVNGAGPGNLFRVGNDSNDFIVVNGTTGNVGIGNTIPNNTLDVSGNVNVSGILHASGVNVSGTVQATTFIGSGSSLTGISSATPVWNSSGTNVYLNDSTGKIGIGTNSPGQKLHVDGSVTIEENLSVTAIEILSNFTYKILGGCFEDTSIDITDDTTFCDTSQPYNVTSVYYNGSWRIKCCVPQRMCFKDTNVTVTDTATVCNKDTKNYSVTSVFYNSDGNWQAKCCNDGGSCFEDKLITPTDPLTICDTEGNSDIVTVGYSTTWEVTCCEGMIR